MLFLYGALSLQDLFKTAHIIFMLIPSSFFSKHFVRVRVEQPYTNCESVTSWKNFSFILSTRSICSPVKVIYVKMKVCFFP